MDASELRALQGPLKERYRQEPGSALTPLSARGDFRDDGITCTTTQYLSVVWASRSSVAASEHQHPHPDSTERRAPWGAALRVTSPGSGWGAATRVLAAA